MSLSKSTIAHIEKQKDKSNNLLSVHVTAKMVDTDGGITDTPLLGIRIEGEALATIMAIPGGAAKRTAFRAEIKRRFLILYDEWVIERDAALPSPNILSSETIATEFGDLDII